MRQDGEGEGHMPGEDATLPAAVLFQLAKLLPDPEKLCLLEQRLLRLLLRVCSVRFSKRSSRY